VSWCFTLREDIEGVSKQKKIKPWNKWNNIKIEEIMQYRLWSVYQQNKEVEKRIKLKGMLR
jgi:hypothetical protein